MKNQLHALALLGFLVLANCGAKEINACNSERVKSTILNKVFVPQKENLIKMYSEHSDTQPEFIKKAKDWKVEITEIRQKQYDPANNIRFCEASLVSNTDIPFSRCMSFVYKIEPLVDKPDSFYVSWSCDWYSNFEGRSE